MSQTKAELINAKGDAAFDTDTLYIDSTNNRVGVGTASPGETLDVSGNAYFGKSGTAGGITFRRPSDGGPTAFIGYPNAADNTDFLIANGGGSCFVRLNAANSSGSLRFDINSNEAMRVDSSGRLLVGTSSASGLDRFVVEGGTGYGAAITAFRRSQVGSAIPSGGEIGYLFFGGNDNTNFASIAAWADGTTGSNDYPGRLVFYTTADGAPSPSERMRITSDGSVLIKATSKIASETLLVTNTAGQAAIFKRGETSGVVEHVRFVDGSNTDCGSIDVNTTANTTAYTTSSDYRLKQNVAPLQGCIDRLNALKPCEWNWISSPETRGEGFLAHEAAEVVPECVTGTKDEVDADGNPIYQGIDQSKLVPLLTAALQEAIAKIESLEARLTAAGI